MREASGASMGEKEFEQKNAKGAKEEKKGWWYSLPFQASVLFDSNYTTTKERQKVHAIPQWRDSARDEEPGRVRVGVAW